jgi:hypothetical protein
MKGQGKKEIKEKNDDKEKTGTSMGAERELGARRSIDLSIVVTIWPTHPSHNLQIINYAAPAESANNR